MPTVIIQSVEDVLSLSEQFSSDKAQNMERSLLDEALAVVPWRILQNDLKVDAPRLSNNPLLFDFTADEDAWMQARDGYNYFQIMKHHAHVETDTVRVLFNLEGPVLELMKLLDHKIHRLAMSNDDVANARGFNWMPLVNFEGDITVSIVVAGSDAPTNLFFICDDGSVAHGVGEEFLKEQVGENKIEDFKCKVKAELQFINVIPDRHQKKLVVKAHSMVFAKAPKETVVSHTESELESIIRAAKRIKVGRL